MLLKINPMCGALLLASLVLILVQRCPILMQSLKRLHAGNITKSQAVNSSQIVSTLTTAMFLVVREITPLTSMCLGLMQSLKQLPPQTPSCNPDVNVIESKSMCFDWNVHAKEFVPGDKSNFFSDSLYPVVKHVWNVDADIFVSKLNHVEVESFNYCSFFTVRNVVKAGSLLDPNKDLDPVVCDSVAHAGSRTLASIESGTVMLGINSVDLQSKIVFTGLKHNWNVNADVFVPNVLCVKVSDVNIDCKFVVCGTITCPSLRTSATLGSVATVSGLRSDEFACNDLQLAPNVVPDSAMREGITWPGTRTSGYNRECYIGVWFPTINKHCGRQPVWVTSYFS